MSSYVHCACRDCFETAIGDAPCLCWECEEAGCDVNGQHECEAPNAYGGSSTEYWSGEGNDEP